jgi:type I restriction enzyme S subunit
MGSVRLVRRVDALFALADKIEARVAAAKEHTKVLRQSILTQAFSGQLVPTEAEMAQREGRDYEPATVLLEWIMNSSLKDSKQKGTKV